MHIPDGMLDTKTFTTLWAGGASGIGYASWWIRRHFDSTKMVLMAVMASLIFALQMLNFPVALGTSGHFAGGAAAAIILGFWPASVVMTAVLIIQALLFGDGGITTLGANIVNLALCAPSVGILVYQLGCRLHSVPAARIISSFLAAFSSVVAAAALVAIELWASGRAPFYPVMTAMVSWHALIGIGEGVITASLIAFLLKVRPSLLGITQPVDKTSVGKLEAEPTSSPGAQVKPTSSTSSAQAGSQQGVVVVFAVIALAAAGLSFLASQHPDGLEYVYFETGIGSFFEELGFSKLAPLADYLIPGVANETLSVVGAGIIGVVLTGSLLFIVSTLIVRSRVK
ncbi:MAG: energy-coupling factor ABC transporter permease [Coriobacteriia bacterium]|nr:energy-coupling factor ABC transporter permease [Coriobacteriia bacterium]